MGACYMSAEGGPRLIQYKQFLQDRLQKIDSEENATIKALYNDTVYNIQLIMNDIVTLNTTLYKSYLFDYVLDYKYNTIEDFYSRLTFDLTRNLGNFPR